MHAWHACCGEIVMPNIVCTQHCTSGNPVVLRCFRISIHNFFSNLLVCIYQNLHYTALKTEVVNVYVQLLVCIYARVYNTHKHTIYEKVYVCFYNKRWREYHCMYSILQDSNHIIIIVCIYIIAFCVFFLFASVIK